MRPNGRHFEHTPLCATALIEIVVNDRDRFKVISVFGLWEPTLGGGL